MSRTQSRHLRRGLVSSSFLTDKDVTNAVSAFTSETMHRAGFERETIIDGLGAGFQVRGSGWGVGVGGWGWGRRERLIL